MPVLKLQDALARFKCDVCEDISSLPSLATVHHSQLDGDAPQDTVLSETYHVRPTEDARQWP